MERLGRRLYMKILDPDDWPRMSCRATRFLLETFLMRVQRAFCEETGMVWRPAWSERENVQSDGDGAESRLQSIGAVNEQGAEKMDADAIVLFHYGCKVRYGDGDSRRR